MQASNRVDFYVLPSDDPGARLRYACRLTEKAYHLQHRIHLHTGSAAEAGELDELLWTFRQLSFVPHEVIGAGATAESPVTIGYGAGPAPEADLLINLASDLPEFASRYARVAEIVDRSEAGRQHGRERFRRYKQQGTEPVTHNIETMP